MDATDLAILGAMTHDRVTMWGGVDPRVSSADIADRVDLHPSTVRTRIRHWEETGFLRGYDVLVNPELLGAETHVASVRVDDPARKDAFFEEAGLVEGVYAAIDHVGPWVGVGIYLDHPDAAERRRGLLAKLPGVGEVEPLFRVRLPAPTADPAQLDWRIVQALREAPADTLASTADRVGVTAKTLRHRLRELLAGDAIWSVADLDFRRYTGGVACRLDLFLVDAARLETVRTAFEERRPDALELNPAPRDPDGGSGLHDRLLEYLIHLESAALADDVLRDAASLDGVDEAEVLFPRRYRSYPDWLDERVERACEGEV